MYHALACVFETTLGSGETLAVPSPLPCLVCAVRKTGPSDCPWCVVLGIDLQFDRCLAR